jgi:23S rRNA G2069 N7-methylase RlmK/C1962 C5-methylase RlmI
MILTARLEAELLKQKWRLPHSFLREIPHREQGILAFANKKRNLFGHFLVDPTLASPIQVINYGVEPIDKPYVLRQLDLALKYRLELSKKGELDISDDAAFRLFNETGDGIPGLAIDIYGRYAMIHVYSRYWKQHLPSIAQHLLRNEVRKVSGVYLASHIREYLDSTENSQTADRNTIVFDSEKEKEKQRQSKVRRNVLESLGLESDEQKSLCFAGSAAPQHKTVVKEHAIKYEIVLNGGPATGLYIDQRDNRRKFRELISNMTSTASTSLSPTLPSIRSPVSTQKSFLNAFCYTCSFSLHAAQCRMTTTNVDLSKLILSRAKKMFEDNDIDPSPHEFYHKDVFEALPKMKAARRSFDVILLDPPTVAKVNRRDGTKFVFSSRDHYDDLIDMAAPLVKPGGYLITFINNTLAVDKHKWRTQILKGFDSVVTKMKPEMEKESFESERKRLRKVNGLRKKARDKILKGMDFTLSEEEIREMWTFKPIAEWTQSPDFRIRDSDQEARHIYGIVWQRTVNQPHIDPSSLLVLLANYDSARGSHDETQPLKTK